jgi:ATP-dependent RNA helicase SUPV3L1/SUV3
MAAAASRSRPPKHVLVSTDAIAYGLNMNIERMVFTTLRKFDGEAMVDLPAATVQQIAGRSGRFGRARQHAVGRCTVLDARDMPHFREAMSMALQPLTVAGLLPTADILQLYVELEKMRAYKSGEEFNNSFFGVVSKFAASCTASELFFPCAMERSLLRIARLLEPVTGLTLTDRIAFCYLPLSDDSAESLRLIVDYAEDLAKGEPVHLRVDADGEAVVQHVRQNSLLQPEQHRAGVAQLERMFRQAEMYCWLSWRFGKTFVEREKCLSLKASIADALTRLNHTLTTS